MRADSKVPRRPTFLAVHRLLESRVLRQSLNKNGRETLRNARANDQERWTVRKAHALHDEQSEAFEKSCSRFKIERILVTVKKFKINSP